MRQCYNCNIVAARSDSLCCSLGSPRRGISLRALAIGDNADHELDKPPQLYLAPIIPSAQQRLDEAINRVGAGGVGQHPVGKSSPVNSVIRHDLDPGVRSPPLVAPVE